MLDQTPNLADVISEAVTAKMTPDFVEEQINSRVDKLVRDAIDQALRTYSDNGKLIQSAVEDALKVDKLDLPSYGQTVTTMLKSKIEELVSPLVAGALERDMTDLLNLAPKTIKLSKIVEEMRQTYEDDGDRFGEDVVTCIIDETEYGSRWIYLDADEHYDFSEKYSAKARFLLSNEGTIFSGTLGSTDIERTRTLGSQGKRKEFGRHYGLEQKLLSYHACGTVIEVDEDAVSTYIDYP